MSRKDHLLPWLITIEKMVKQRSYKPILLLSIIVEIELGTITKNQINLTDSIVERFNNFYEEIGNHQALNMAYLPFYHLERDIWDLKWENGNYF